MRDLFKSTLKEPLHYFGVLLIFGLIMNGCSMKMVKNERMLPDLYEEPNYSINKVIELPQMNYKDYGGFVFPVYVLKWIDIENCIVLGYRKYSEKKLYEYKDALLVNINSGEVNELTKEEVSVYESLLFYNVMNYELTDSGLKKLGKVLMSLATKHMSWSIEGSMQASDGSNFKYKGKYHRWENRSGSTKEAFSLAFDINGIKKGLSTVFNTAWTGSFSRFLLNNSISPNFEYMQFFKRIQRLKDSNEIILYSRVYNILLSSCDPSWTKMAVLRRYPKSGLYILEIMDFILDESEFDK